MGSLTRFPLGTLVDQGVSCFIETGTYLGDSLAYAAQFPFQTLYSIECAPERVVRARERFAADPRVTILAGDSAVELPRLLTQLGGVPVACWLDAHYPEQGEPVIVLPLAAELDALVAYPGIAQSVLFVDDRRVYEAFPENALPEGYERGDPALFDDVATRLLATHVLERLGGAQGYGVFVPRAWAISFA